jgi:alpha-tubulin suppressor-like RCC1 family protein
MRLAGMVSSAPPVAAAAASVTGKLTYIGEGGLWTSDGDGGNARLVFPTGESNWWVVHPQWSHDGTKIVFGYGVHYNFQTRVINADGSDLRSFPETGPSEAFWSLDDRRLLFIAGSSYGGIGYVEVDGSGDGYLFNNEPHSGHGDLGGTLSPDGSRIAFVRRPPGGGAGQVFVVDTDGTNLVKITDGSGGSDDGPLHWSPDGNRLLFTGSVSIQTHVAVVNADGSGRRTLRENAAPWGWSPDGTQILFRDRAADTPTSSSSALWRMRADGTGAAPVASPAYAWDVDWTGPQPPMAAVSGGGIHTLALGVDGRVWAFGSNAQGQVGIGAAAESRTPVAVPGLGPTYAISAGILHSLAVMDDATVKAWGYNGLGLLGDGTTIDRHQPVTVAGLSSMVATAAGFYHSLGLRSDGTVWAWGWNGFGELGDGTTTGRLRAAQVPGLTEVVAISAGAYHSLALRSDGSVWAWGYNEHGELGIGAGGEAHGPTRVADLGPVTAISAGLYHSLAIRSDGTVWAWGYNGFGQLGTGDTVDARSPVPVGGLRAATSVGAGGLHSLAAMDDGSVRAWGWNGVGQLGDGTTTDSLVAVEVVHVGTVTAVSAGMVHSVAVVGSGTMWAWGWDAYGQLGAGIGSFSSIRVPSRT